MAIGTGPSTRDATNWSAVNIAVAAAIVVAFQVGKLPAALPQIRDDLGMSLLAAGFLVSMFNAIACAIGMMIGAVADAFGARRIIFTALLIVAAASLLGSSATSTAWLLTARFFEGLGGIVVLVAGPILIMRAVATRDMRLAFGIWGTYMPAGVACMVLATPLLLGAIGWRGVWVLNAVVLLAFLVPFALHAMAAPDDQTRPARGERLARFRRDLAAVISRPGPWLLALSFACYAGSYLCVMAFLPTYLIEARGFSAGLAASLTALVVAVNVPGNLIAGWLLHRGVRRWLLVAVACATMGLASIGIYAPWLSDAWAVGCAVLYSLVGGMLPASVLGAVPQHAPSPEQVGAVNGFVMQLGNTGQLIAPPVLAGLVASTSWAAGAWLLGGLGAAGVLIALLIGLEEAAAKIGR